MRRLKLRPWRFDKNEEVELYWHGAPFLNSEGLWMIKCLFRGFNGRFKEQAYPFATLPYLRIGQKYIDGDFTEKTNGSIYKVIVANSTHFDLCKGFDFPKRLYPFNLPPAPSYGNLPVCRFEINGFIYYIPCIEIVRSILAPYRMLANKILRPEGLDGFIEESNESFGKLSLSFNEEFPAILLRDDAILYFVWLRYNAAVKKTWDSVYKNFILDTNQQSNEITSGMIMKSMPIRVVPPQFGRSTWVFRGLEYNNHILILELISRSDLEIPFNEIEIFHPKLDKRESDNRPRYVIDPDKKNNDDNDTELDTTGQGSEKQNSGNTIEQPPVMFSFKNKPRIVKNTNRRRT